MPINKITQEDLEVFAAVPKLDIYQGLATKSAIYPGKGSLFGISYCAHKLAGEAGEFNEHFGKAMRDDGLFSAKVHHYMYEDSMTATTIHYNVSVKPLTDERHELLVKELGDCLWYISALCNELGISLSQVAMKNLLKLKDRTDRGKLQGGGDER